MANWLLTPEEWTAVSLSVQVALIATVLSLPAGIAPGYVLARRRFYGKSLVETVLNLPLVLPPVVVGHLLLVLLGRRGLVGEYLDSWLGIHLAFTWRGAALASAVMAFPLMVWTIRLAFAQTDTRLEQAARTLGAGAWEAFWRISLPLARRGILAGAVVGFARGLGEFCATLMLAGNIPGVTQTIPLLIYSQSNSPGGIEESSRLVLASIAISVASLAIAGYLERKR